MNIMDSSTILMIFEGLLVTLYITAMSTILSFIIGLPAGIMLVLTSKGGIKENKVIYNIIDFVTNILRSVPFLVLMITVLPLARAITGSALGANAVIVALVIAAAPFVARMVESSIKEVDSGVIEASLSMGATPWQIVTKVMIKEAMPSLILNMTIATTTILGYTAMAGAIGAGGLGDIAIRYGYIRYRADIMLVTVLLLIIIVQVIQAVGMSISRKVDKRN